ncbi:MULTISPECIES: response regulator transcription factor [unclassified Rhizobium]|uniref:response regulator transcription factor n=1 Tax=unclassified Rhizobium TaxID=2613769 RepID=UPI001ADB68D7|nr:MULTISPECIES: response regulator transcription factor [unclassified Rhizobium]MBO9127764.1 response regulator transcription factor [Rhizobium sp. 16-488-2b]MBO9178226.1 response regulator transcription factor [Rhizobium sp. 16-488-2a]
MSAPASNRAHDAIATNADTPLVVVVDDDEGMRDGVRDVLRSVGIDSLGFSSTAELLAEPLPDRPGCLILDVRLPGLSGLDLQAKLNGMGNKLPIVFMTGYADVPMSVRAMKAGATDFLTKPFRDQEMLDAVSVAIERDRARRLELGAANEAIAAAASLTPRESEVMEAVAKGLLNKQIAHLLTISEVTVKIHRGNVMRKMNVTSLADLVRKVEILKSIA